MDWLSPEAVVKLTGDIDKLWPFSSLSVNIPVPARLDDPEAWLLLKVESTVLFRTRCGFLDLDSRHVSDRRGSETLYILFKS